MPTVTARTPRVCNDPMHDDRWCSTCEAMWDGIHLLFTFIENYPGIARDLPKEEGAYHQFVMWVKAFIKSDFS